MGTHTDTGRGARVRGAPRPGRGARRAARSGQRPTRDPGAGPAASSRAAAEGDRPRAGQAHRRAVRAPSRSPERGSASLELLGIIPLLMLVAMAGIQLGIVAYAGSQAGSAARSAARTAALGDRAETSPEAAGRASVSDWLRDGTDIATSDTGDGVRATATIEIPSIFPGFDFDSVARQAEMPKD